MTQIIRKTVTWLPEENKKRKKRETNVNKENKGQRKLTKAKNQNIVL